MRALKNSHHLIPYAVGTLVKPSLTYYYYYLIVGTYSGAATLLPVIPTM